MSLSAAVLGASGYAGGELVRLLDAHPALEVTHLGAHTRQGELLASVHPQLSGGERRLGTNDPEGFQADVTFLALPHGASAEVGRELVKGGGLVVDLGSDFRLDNSDRYRRAYGTDHPYPEEMSDWVYGLPELFDVGNSRAIAAPGCYPTAVLLALAPLLEAGVAQPGGVVANCLSGASGAGREANPQLTFGAVDEGVRAYGVTTHRHRPEIEMGLDLRLSGEHHIVFTPHLVPMQRGLLATVSARAETTTDDARTCLQEFYAASPFVDVVDIPPQTRWVVGSNRALVTAFFDAETETLIVQCAIDNLGKGAAGQAIQAANIALDMDETTGLTSAGWMP